MLPTFKLSKHTQGFTFVELLIVVGILSIISGITIPNFNSYINNQNMVQAQEQVKSDIRSIQNRALTGVGQVSGNTHWLIRFDSNASTYMWRAVSSGADGILSSSEASTLCSGTTTANSETSSQLNSSIVIRGANVTKCTYFTIGNGDTAILINPGASPSYLTTCANPSATSNCSITLGYATSTAGCGKTAFNAAGLTRNFYGSTNACAN